MQPLDVGERLSAANGRARGRQERGSVRWRTRVRAQSATGPSRSAASMSSAEMASPAQRGKLRTACCDRWKSRSGRLSARPGAGARAAAQKQKPFELVEENDTAGYDVQHSARPEASLYAHMESEALALDDAYDIEDDNDDEDTTATSNSAPSPLEEYEEAHSSSGSSSRLQISKADFTVGSLVDKIRRGKVNLAPRYQREYVWTVSTASKLVESLLINVPVPTVFFCEASDGSVDVVDGKQRISSVYAFICGEFPDGTPFRLKGLEVLSDLNGKTFDELDPVQKETIQDYPLSTNTLARNTESQHVYEVFERLNMGATSLNDMELRNAVFSDDGSGYTSLLAQLASHSTFLRINRLDRPHSRQLDRELVLRFFALQTLGPDNAFTPVKRMLNREMEAGMRMKKTERKNKSKLWNKVMTLADGIFGPECAFRRPVNNASNMPEPESEQNTERFESGPVDRNVFDTVAHSLALMDEKKALEPEAKACVLQTFIVCFDSATMRNQLKSEKSAIKNRHELWMKALQEEQDERDINLFAKVGSSTKSNSTKSGDNGSKKGSSSNKRR